VAWLNVTIGHGTNVVGIGLARIIENDEYASLIGTSSFIKSNTSGARFELNWPRKDLLDRAKSIRTSLYGGIRPSFARISSSDRVHYSARDRTGRHGKTRPGSALELRRQRTTRPFMIMNRRRFAAGSVAALLTSVGGTQIGCTTSPSGWRAPSVQRIFAPRPVATNPLAVPSADFEFLWNKTVAVVDKYFDIESENRLARTIKTQPQSAATVLEPWAFDSVKIEDRVEASMQTIRRSAIIHIDPAPNGGFLVKVEVYKFLEDMIKPDRQAAGRAVFSNDFPVNRTREIVGPVPAPVGWIQRGRDLDLEQAILAGIRDALFL
jgi:hypothetical protein